MKRTRAEELCLWARRVAGVHLGAGEGGTRARLSPLPSPLTTACRCGCLHLHEPRPTTPSSLAILAPEISFDRCCVPPAPRHPCPDKFHCSPSGPPQHPTATGNQGYFPSHGIDPFVVATHSDEGQGAFGYWIHPMGDGSSGYLQPIWMAVM